MLGVAQSVVSNVTKVVSSTTTSISTAVEQHIEGELSLFTMSDHKVLDLILATHVHSDESFDEDSLFLIVENILKRATQIVDKIVQVYILILIKKQD